MQPQVDFELAASSFCFLNRERAFDIWLNVRLHYREPITLSTTGSIFDPAATFFKSRLEIVDTETGEKVEFPESQTLAGEENFRSAEAPTLFLRPEVSCCIYWSTEIHDGRLREHLIDMSRLAPNRQYTVRYRDHGITNYFIGSPPAQQENSSDVEVQLHPVAVKLLGKKAPSFTTRPTLPPPPPITSFLSTSTPSCSLSGNPPFTVILDWKLDGDRAIFALLTRRRGMNIGLEVRDPERNGHRIGPPADGTWGDRDDSPPPDEEELVRLEKMGDSFSQSYTLATKPKLRGIILADTWNFKSGNTYALTLKKTQWRWLYEDEVEDAVLQDRAMMIERLGREPKVQWKPDCRVEFRAD